jgi:MOSC domain-containing protein YiiM
MEPNVLPGVHEAIPEYTVLMAHPDGSPRPGNRSLNPASPLARLLTAPMRPGIVTWIGLRPGRQQPMLAVTMADLDASSGLAGDHYASHVNQTRQVSLIQSEHITAIARYLGLEQIGPDRLRRKIVVSGINLLALKGQRFRLGSALLLATGECHPCSRMETALGRGGYNAVRGHGGITARILNPGRVQLGDTISRVDE